jgi:hypothetical protein
MATAWTAVVTEVAHVRGCIGIRRATTDAVLRIGGVLKRRAGDRRVVDPKAKRPFPALGERSDQWVVGVDDQERRIGETRRIRA